MLLDAFGVPATSLILEITEDVLMADAARSQQVMAGLRQLGVRLSIDDYGTGYSSLSYLRALPVDELKLDRSFVSHLTTDERAAAIVRSTLQLSLDLGMNMVVEGVEDAAALAALRAWGCDYAQGRPTPPWPPPAGPATTTSSCSPPRCGTGPNLPYRWSSHPYRTTHGSPATGTAAHPCPRWRGMCW